MSDDSTLVLAMHEVLKAVRLLKQNRAGSGAVPAGSIGVLATIRQRGSGGPCHGKDLASDSALDPSTISRAVAALVRAGLVARIADPDDGRASILQLTDDGSTVLDSVQQHYQDRLTTALQNWSDEEIAEFAAALHRFARDVIDQETHTLSLEAAR